MLNFALTINTIIIITKQKTRPNKAPISSWIIILLFDALLKPCHLGFTLTPFSAGASDIKPKLTEVSFGKMVEPLRKGVKQKIQFETVHQRKNGSLYEHNR